MCEERLARRMSAALCGALFIILIILLTYLSPVLFPESTASHSPFLSSTIAALDRMVILDGERFNLGRFNSRQLADVANNISDLPERSRISFYSILCARPEVDRIYLLVNAMADPSIFVRCDVISGSKMFSKVDSGVIRAALVAISEDIDPQLRRHAADALGYYCYPECEVRLNEMARDTDGIVVYNAIGSLERMRKINNGNLSIINDLVYHENPLVRNRVASILKAHMTGHASAGINRLKGADERAVR
mgnify:CR=1 FL=1